MPLSRNKFRGLVLAFLATCLASVGLCNESATSASISATIAKIEKQLDDGQFKDARDAVRKLSLETANLNLPKADRVKILRISVRSACGLEVYDDCRDFGEKALALLGEKPVGTAEEMVAVEGDLAVALRHLDDSEARTRFRHSLKVFSDIPKPDPQEHSNVLLNYGIFLYFKGDLENAATFTEEAIEKRKSAKPVNEASVAQALDNLGTILTDQGRLSKAEEALRESLAIRQRTLRPDHPDIASSLNNLGVLLHKRGEYSEALENFYQAEAIDKATFSAGHPEVLLDLNNVAEVLRSTGRLQEALNLELQVLTAREAALKASGGDENENYDVAVSNGNVANLLGGLRHYREAEAYYSKALRLDRARTEGKPNSDVALDLNNIGENLRAEEKWTEAEKAYEEGLGIASALGRTADLTRATLLQDLGVLYIQVGKRELALKNLRLAAEIRSATLPSDHIDIAIAKAWYARALLQAGDAGALTEARASLSILKQRNARSSLGASAAAVAAEAASEREIAENILAVLSEQPNGASGDLDPELADDVLSALQIAHSTGTSVIASRVAAALLSGDSGMSGILRQIQDLRDKREMALNQQMSEAAESKAETKTSTVEIDRELNALLAKIPASISSIVDSGDDLKFANIRALLGADECWLGFVVAPQRTFVVAATAGGVRINQLNVTRKALESKVGALVDELKVNSAKRFDLALSHDLFVTLFSGVDGELASHPDLTVVADGPLQRLPLAVLVKAFRQGTDDDDQDLMDATWLADEAVITVVPSFSVAASLARAGTKERGEKVFVGFGDPVLGPPEEPDADPAVLKNIFGVQGTPAAVKSVLKLATLPATGLQLDAMNEIFAKGKGEVYKGPAATKSAVLNAQLKNFRVIAFATHGLLPTESAVGEPSLVLTPENDKDDGLLTTTEIAALHINADLVVLSACNTAAPRAGYDADGLSGLAQSFFHAGAKAVLVSHWSVDVNATHELIKLLSSAKGKSVSMALHDAMVALRHKQGFVRPAFWGPFDLVGRGDLVVGIQ